MVWEFKCTPCHIQHFSKLCIDFKAAIQSLIFQSFMLEIIADEMRNNELEKLPHLIRYLDLYFFLQEHFNL